MILFAVSRQKFLKTFRLLRQNLYCDKINLLLTFYLEMSKTH